MSEVELKQLRERLERAKEDAMDAASQLQNLIEQIDGGTKLAPVELLDAMVEIEESLDTAGSTVADAYIKLGPVEVRR